MMEKRTKLYPRQYDFFTCPDRIAAFIGGIRSGKTYAGCLWMLSQMTVPGTLGLIVAPTFPMLRDVTWRTMLDIGGDIFKVGKTEMMLSVPNGGEMLFRSADTPDRIRGITANVALIDEAGYCPGDTYDIVKGRLSALPGLMRIVTTPKGRNWLYERQGEMTIFRAATKDNPYIPKDFVTDLEHSYTGDFKRQELYGEFVAFEGLVYPMFSRDLHVRTRERAEMTRILFGEDEGYTNPSVILDVGIDNDGRVHVYREWYRRNQLQDAVVSANKGWYDEVKPSAVVVDASAAGLIASLRDIGVPAVAHKGRVLDGIGKVQNALAVQADGKPRLTIDPSCVQTIAEFESYVWKEGKDEPEKQSDHAMDALRYVLDEIEGGGVEVVASPFDF
jgi:PBSX family phage terminase large subunit